MKNLKNIAAAATLTAVLMMGATTAQAGLMVSDRAATGAEQCAEEETGFFGLLVSDLAGLLMSDRAGLLVSDRAGLLVSDRAGLMVSDKAEVKPCEQATFSGFLLSD